MAFVLLDPRVRDSYIEISEGNPGSLQTLDLMRTFILDPSQNVVTEAAVGDILAQSEGLPPLELARRIFEWVRSHMLYYPDVNSGAVIEEIRSPGYLLQEIDQLGAAVGDCDDYVILLCGLYTRLGFPCRMVAISRHADTLLDHVYCQVQVEGRWVTADGIVDFPFGWEAPPDDVTNRVEYPV